MDFYDIIRFIIVFQFLFFSFFLFTTKKGNRISNLIFGIFLFSKSLCFANGLIFRFGGEVLNFSPHVFFIGETFEFLLGPAIYFYALSLTRASFSFSKRDLYHLVPFILHFIFMFFRYHMYGYEAKLELLNSYVFTRMEYIIIQGAIYIHFMIYSALGLLVLKKFRAELKNFYSGLKNIKLGWLSMVLVMFIILWGTSLIAFLLNMTGSQVEYPYGLSVFLMFIFTNYIFYKGLKYPEIFAGLEPETAVDKPLIAEDKFRDYLESLENYMSRDKPYLNPDITLNELAGGISIPPRYISFVINRSFSQNFYDYINSYRIKESKMMLSDSSHNKTILDILYSSGFNSKSAFNSAFRKQVGITPSEFRRKNIN